MIGFLLTLAVFRLFKPYCLRGRFMGQKERTLEDVCEDSSHSKVRPLQKCCFFFLCLADKHRDVNINEVACKR